MEWRKQTHFGQEEGDAIWKSAVERPVSRFDDVLHLGPNDQLITCQTEVHAKCPIGMVYSLESHKFSCGRFGCQTFSTLKQHPFTAGWSAVKPPKR